MAATYNSAWIEIERGAEAVRWFVINAKGAIVAQGETKHQEHASDAAGRWIIRHKYAYAGLRSPDMPATPTLALPICTARLPSGVEHAAQFRVPVDMPAVDLIGVGVRRYDAVLDLLFQVEPVVVAP